MTTACHWSASTPLTLQPPSTCWLRKGAAWPAPSSHQPTSHPSRPAVRLEGAVCRRAALQGPFRIGETEKRLCEHETTSAVVCAYARCPTSEELPPGSRSHRFGVLFCWLLDGRPCGASSWGVPPRACPPAPAARHRQSPPPLRQSCRCHRSSAQAYTRHVSSSRARPQAACVFHAWHCRGALRRRPRGRGARTSERVLLEALAPCCAAPHAPSCSPAATGRSPRSRRRGRRDLGAWAREAVGRRRGRPRCPGTHPCSPPPPPRPRPRTWSSPP